MSEAGGWLLLFCKKARLMGNSAENRKWEVKASTKWSSDWGHQMLMNGKRERTKTQRAHRVWGKGEFQKEMIKNCQKAFFNCRCQEEKQLNKGFRNSGVWGEELSLKESHISQE